jgi:hypothetical protein
VDGIVHRIGARGGRVLTCGDLRRQNGDVAEMVAANRASLIGRGLTICRSSNTIPITKNLVAVRSKTVFTIPSEFLILISRAVPPPRAVASQQPPRLTPPPRGC